MSLMAFLPQRVKSKANAEAWPHHRKGEKYCQQRGTCLPHQESVSPGAEIGEHFLQEMALGQSFLAGSRIKGESCSPIGPVSADQEAGPKCCHTQGLIILLDSYNIFQTFFKSDFPSHLPAL